MNPFSFRDWRSLWRRGQVKRDIDDELNFHIEQRVRDNQAAGLEPEAAEREARKQFGNFQSVREDCRATRRIGWVDGLARDFRFGLRVLARNPLFTGVALLSLALGIGANTAVFSLINGVMLRSLAVPDPQALRVVEWSGIEPKTGMFCGSMRTVVGAAAQRTKPGDGPLTFANAFTHEQFLAMRERCSAQAEVFGFVDAGQVTVRVQHETFLASGTMVSSNYFSALGVRPVAGRFFNAQEEGWGGAPTIVITHGWWQRYFAKSPGIIGQSISLNGIGYTVIGVLPPEFYGVKLYAENEFYVPLSAQPHLMSGVTGNAPDHWWISLMARLMPGVHEVQLQQALESVFAAQTATVMQSPQIAVLPGHAGPNNDRAGLRRPLLILLGAVGTVLLIACANLAGLMLARGAARQHEYSVRAALGAGSWRLARQSLVESMLLAALGGGLGVLVALWGKTALSRLLAGTAEGLRYDIPLDWRVLAFAGAVALLAGVLSGLLPALKAGWVNPLDGLKERGAIGSAKLRAGRMLVAGQIALSLLLVAGAGLYARTLFNLVCINPGFNPQNLLLFQMSPAAAGLAPMEVDDFFNRAQASLAGIPGVRGTTLLQMKLLSGSMSGGGFFKVPAHPEIEGNRPQANRLTVGGEFFRTMEIPILDGRGFANGDTVSGPKVVVVNRTFARKYFPGENAVGQTLRLGEYAGHPVDWRIAGVCGDAKYSGLKPEIPPTVYFCCRQEQLGSAWFAVRTTVPPLALAGTVRHALRAVDPRIPVAGITTQQRVMAEDMAQETLFAVMCGSLAGLAVLLACLGLYGLMAYHVSRRAHEFGVRLALGAGRRDIAWPIVREAGLLALAGIGLGLPVVLALARVIRNQLYGVAPTDPWILGGAAVLLAIVATLAAWIPARRAARMDPMLALRCE